MIQKLLIGGLALGIIAVIGFGIIDAGRVPDESESIVLNVTDGAFSEPTIPPTDPQPTQPLPTEPPTIQPDMAVTPQPEPVVEAANLMGDAWLAEGTVSVLEDFGFTLATAEGDFFVELGPPTYWQAQGVPLAAGDTVSVDGYYNGEQVHARVVNTTNGELVIRSESGQPMWAGGADHTDGNNQQGAGQMQSQVMPEDWLTLTGVIGRVSKGQVTLNADDGTMLDLQMGQPQFWQSQGITLTTGDRVEVLGFWSGNQFMAGDIRKTETGETIMLRDPNGRQLWAGPGRNGQNNGNQNDNGQDDNGNGNQYRGGREG